MKILITEQQLNLLIEKQSKKQSKFFELLTKYMYEPKSKYPFNLWNLSKEIKDWADITYSERYDRDGDLEETTESLDMENNEILALTKDKLIFRANGDWQPEHVATVKLVNGKLSMTDCRPYDKKIDGKDKPTKNELLKILGLEEDYNDKQKEYKKKGFEKLINDYVDEYNQWNTDDGRIVGYENPSETSVLEFIQNNHEQYNEDKKLQKELLKKLKDKENINESKDNESIAKSIKFLHDLPIEYKEFALQNLKSYTKAKNGVVTGLELHPDLVSKIKEKDLPNGFDMGVDKNGYFILTHRARSKSHENPVDITVKEIKFIDSTG